MKKRLVVANWKMYIERTQEAVAFAKTLRKNSRTFSDLSVMVAPPYTLLPAVATTFKGSTVKVAGQAISAHTEPKHTGEISAAMLKGAGASAVIIGHSERRAAGEGDESVRAQLERAINAGIMPILCVGESERDPGGSHFALVGNQLSSALKGLGKQVSSVVVAYEPVWAIGKSASEAMKPGELREMAIFIRKTLAEIMDRPTALKVPIIYGGSVEPENAKQLMEEGDVAGFLVGHASTDIKSFLDILKSCRKK